MKIKDDLSIMKYVYEYMQYGIEERFFSKEQATYLYDKIINTQLEYASPNLSGDAFYKDGVLHINAQRTLSSEKFASLVLYHEFTHMCSKLHEDMYSSRSKLMQFRDYMSKRIDTSYMYGYNITKSGDINNPYTYFMYGALLLDEVTAENVATQMVAKKYGIDRKSERRTYTRRLGHLGVTYTSDFEYYGIGQEIADKFAKSLFLRNEDKNLNGLSREIFKDGFVKNLILQHNERPDALESLFKELCYMGVISFNEENINHPRERAHKKPIPVLLVYDSYRSLMGELENAREPRESMPANIRAPEFLS